MKRVVIYFRDLTVDWVDPIEDESKDIVYTDKLMIIDNGAHKYEYERSKVKTISVIEIEDK